MNSKVKGNYDCGMQYRQPQKCTKCKKTVHHSKAISIAWIEGEKSVQNLWDYSKGVVCRDCNRTEKETKFVNKMKLRAAKIKKKK